MNDSFEQNSLKIEEGTGSEDSSSTTENILRKYSEDKSNKTRFLELACQSLDKIESSTSAKFYLMRRRVACPVERRFEESLSRDLLAKCRLLVGLRIFLVLLEKNQPDGLEHFFQYQQSLFGQFRAKLDACVSTFESKENIRCMETVLEKVLSREEGWSSWKQRKCEGNIHLKRQVKATPKTKFSELEAENVKVKVKTLEEGKIVRKFIFKRASEKKEGEKMKNWISLNENHDLLGNLETGDLWMDPGEIGMDFAVMARECLGGNSLAQVKAEVEKFEDGHARAEVDEFVKWRFTNRLVKRSFESMISDHERDFCGFLAKNVNCFKNRSINEKLGKAKYSKEGALLRQRNQMKRESWRAKGAPTGDAEEVSVHSEEDEEGDSRMREEGEIKKPKRFKEYYQSGKVKAEKVWTMHGILRKILETKGVKLKEQAKKEEEKSAKRGSESGAKEGEREKEGNSESKEEREKAGEVESEGNDSEEGEVVMGKNERKKRRKEGEEGKRKKGEEKGKRGKEKEKEKEKDKEKDKARGKEKIKRGKGHKKEKEKAKKKDSEKEKPSPKETPKIEKQKNEESQSEKKNKTPKNGKEKREKEGKVKAKEENTEEKKSKKKRSKKNTRQKENPKFKKEPLGKRPKKYSTDPKPENLERGKSAPDPNFRMDPYLGKVYESNRDNFSRRFDFGTK